MSSTILFDFRYISNFPVSLSHFFSASLWVQDIEHPNLPISDPKEGKLTSRLYHTLALKSAV